MESLHHLQWPKKHYNGRHERWLRSQLVIPTQWGLHRNLHMSFEEPPKIEIASTLCVLDYLQEKDSTKADAPLYAIDRLQGLNQEARDLADHFIKQLGFLGVEGV